MTIFILTLLVGIISGLIIGLLGGGSGLVLVPGISFILEKYYLLPHNMVMQFAVGTTFAVTFCVVLFTVYSQHRRGAILWLIFKKLFLGILIGTMLGNILANNISSKNLQLIFGIAVLLLGIRFIVVNEKKFQSKPWPNSWSVFSAASFFGLVCGALGIAPFVVPYLKRYGVSMHEAIATSTACGLLFALVGGITAILIGWHTTQTIHYAFGYFYLPIFLPLFIGCVVFAECGVRLAHKMSANSLKKIYCGLLFIVALKMIF